MKNLFSLLWYKNVIEYNTKYCFIIKVNNISAIFALDNFIAYVLLWPY